jgi:hypothetical protein
MAFLPLLAGLSAKAYDDLNDNVKLKSFKNETFMEYLKGIHYISLTATSIDDPLFFYIFVLSVILNYLTNQKAFNDPYEHSLMYSFLLLFIVVNPVTVTLEWIDWLLALTICLAMFLEPVFSRHVLKNKEVSVLKLFTRVLMLIGTLFCLLFAKSKTMVYLISYFIGYFILSCISQYYSIKIKKLK